MGLSLGELAVRYGCELQGDPDVVIDHVATLTDAKTGSVSFLANPLYRANLAKTAASAVVVIRSRQKRS